MPHRPAWAPDDIDIEQPSVARMYDYFLGGSHNFAADRALAEQAMRVFPDAPHLVRANRAFLHRVVTYLAGSGIDQFLDLGSGIPTGGNVHDVAYAANPAARTVYVDSDPVAVAHSKALLADLPYATVRHADLRDPESILGDPVLADYLDLSRPVAVLLVSVLPFIPDSDDPAEVVAVYREATAPGSYLAISHGTSDYQPEAVRKVENVYAKSSQPGTFRSRAEILALMPGYELVPPGLVDVIHWRPDSDALAQDPLGGDVARYSILAGLGLRT